MQPREEHTPGERIREERAKSFRKDKGFIEDQPHGSARNKRGNQGKKLTAGGEGEDPISGQSLGTDRGGSDFLGSVWWRGVKVHKDQG